MPSGDPVAERASTAPAATGFQRFVRSRGFKLALFLSLQVVAVLVVLEILARIADPLGISYYPETAKFFDHAVREEPIGYRFPPNLEDRFWGAQVSFNTLGMRDREVDVEPAADEFRILVMGDSWPFGLGVDDEHTVPRLLEDRLNETLGGDLRFRTLNMGIPSYNTEQELIRLEELGLRLQPRLVLLVFAVNDIEPKTWVLDKRRGLVVNAAQRSYAASLLTILQRRIRRAVGTGSKPTASDPFEAGNPRWMAVENPMLSIREICRERGIPFVLITMLREEAKPLAMLRALGQRADFPVVNVLPNADPRWADTPMRELQNSAVDSHPNEAGSEVYATLIFEALARLGVLPGTAGPVPVSGTTG
jgi:lysophospholipase L1-like esterase